MSVIEIRDPKSESAAKIAPALGFNCFQFEAHLPDGRVVSVLNAPVDFDAGRHTVGRYGNPILFPFPNRIAKGMFSWQGRDYLLSPQGVLFDEIGNAIHGFCIDRPWRIIQQNESSVTGVFRLSIDAPERHNCWPADAEIQIRYEVKGASLLSRIRVFNPDSKPLPWGFGTHAYFNVPLCTSSNAANCFVEIPSEDAMRLEQCLPTGEITKVAHEKKLRDGGCFEGLKADDAYTALIPEAGEVVCRIRDNDAAIQLEQRCSTDFRELVAFTPWWSQSVCMEPYTCMTNAINLHERGIDAGLRILAPGEEWTGFIDLHVVPTRS